MHITKAHWRKSIAVLMAFMLVLAMMSGVTASAADTIHFTMTINRTKASIAPGKTVRLYLSFKYTGSLPTYYDYEKQMPPVAWKSSNDKIAKVNASGLVTGVAVGSATIEATMGTASLRCSVTVAKAPLSTAVTPKSVTGSVTVEPPEDRAEEGTAADESDVSESIDEEPPPLEEDSPPDEGDVVDAGDEYVAGDAEPDYYDEEAPEEEIIDDTKSSRRKQFAAGVLTAGEWNDNENYSFLKKLMKNDTRWSQFQAAWKIDLSRRFAVKVESGNKPLVNVTVKLLNASKKTLWTGISDNQGRVYLFNGIGEQAAGTPAYIRVTVKGETSDIAIKDTSKTVYTIVLPEVKARGAHSLDLMLMIDTTGSMGDELTYIRTELVDVVKQVRKANANIPVRVSANVYRDVMDEYVVRSNPFSTNVQTAVDFLYKQEASGGGDYPEAVEMALANAIREHDWNADATARILLLVLDAPPHNTSEIRAEMHKLIKEAAVKGIRIIPVASSGVDKDTEFLLRSCAAATGGTYTFLTDHSGVGNSHLEPTIGAYEVEALNELLIRVINQYVKTY